MPSLFERYQPPVGTYDELFDADGVPRSGMRRVIESLGASTPEEFERSQGLAELAMLNQGVTFSV